MIVLIDNDEVLNNLADRWIEILCTTYGLQGKENRYKVWRMEDNFPELTSEQIYKPLRDKNIYDRVKKTEYSEESVQELQSDGHIVKIVTAAHQHQIPQSIAWILGNFSCLRYEDIIITSNKELIRGDVLIDDGIHNFKAQRSLNLLMNRHWNKNIEAPGLIRVYNLKEAVKVIREHNARGNIINHAEGQTD